MYVNRNTIGSLSNSLEYWYPGKVTELSHRYKYVGKQNICYSQLLVLFKKRQVKQNTHWLQEIRKADLLHGLFNWIPENNGSWIKIISQNKLLLNLFDFDLILLVKLMLLFCFFVFVYRLLLYERSICQISVKTLRSYIS